MVSFPNEIAPQGSGEIKVKASTSGRGRNFSQSFYIFSNDKKYKKITLKISINTIPKVKIIPGKVSLWGKVGENIEEKVKIIKQKNINFNIKKIIKANGNNIEYKLEQKNPDSFTLIVKNIKKTKGTYYDVIFLKTDNAKVGTIRINVYGNIKE